LFVVFQRIVSTFVCFQYLFVHVAGHTAGALQAQDILLEALPLLGNSGNSVFLLAEFSSTT
jgi:hypothetical protein